MSAQLHEQQVLPPNSDSGIIDTLRQETRRFTTSKEFAAFVEHARKNPKEFPLVFLQYVASMGYLGMDIPEAYGGVAFSPREQCAVLQELSRGDAGLGLSTLVPNSLVAYPIATFGTEQQKEQVLPLMAEGAVFGCFGLTEADVGSDAKAIQTRAVWDETQNKWIINGNKNFITGANGARFMVLAARTGTPENREKGISVFLADFTASSGVTVSEPMDKLGQFGSTLCQVHFDDFALPAEALMGNINEGWRIIEKTLEHSRITIAAQGAGIVERSYDEAAKFARERVQWITPAKSRTIDQIPRVANRLAMLQRQRDITNYLVQKAAMHEEMKDPDTVAWASLAKLIAGETAPWAALESMLTHGGAGYITESEIAHVFTSAPVVRIYEGTADIQARILKQFFTLQQLLMVAPPQFAGLRSPTEFASAEEVINTIATWTTR